MVQARKGELKIERSGYAVLARISLARLIMRMSA